MSLPHPGLKFLTRRCHNRGMKFIYAVLLAPVLLVGQGIANGPEGQKAPAANLLPPLRQPAPEVATGPVPIETLLTHLAATHGMTVAANVPADLRFELRIPAGLSPEDTMRLCFPAPLFKWTRERWGFRVSFLPEPSLKTVALRDL